MTVILKDPNFMQLRNNIIECRDKSNDLDAAEAVYHGKCYKTFVVHKHPSRSTLKKPKRSEYGGMLHWF